MRIERVDGFAQESYRVNGMLIDAATAHALFRAGALWQRERQMRHGDEIRFDDINDQDIAAALAQAATD